MFTYIEYRLTKQGEETATWEAIKEFKAKSRRQAMKILRDEDENADPNGAVYNVQRKVRIKE
jgi:hypothetical protein